MRPTVLALIMAGLLAPSASAGGQPVYAVEGTDPEGQKVRYEALPDDGDTFVQRLRPATGEPLASRVLRGELQIPVVAYDGTAGGLSADGKTLVLVGTRRAKTIFMVLDAPALRVRKMLTLPGTYAFDALSPDGSWLFLIHHTSPKDPLQYEVLAMDIRTARLNPKPIVDKREPDEKMNGHPLTRATSADGRWAYTLYQGAEHPFVHALDTARREARCIDLDWLTGRKSLPLLRFALADRKLSLRAADGETVAVVDTTTFEASPPSAAGVASWPKAGLSALGLLAVLAALGYVVRARLSPS